MILASRPEVLMRLFRELGPRTVGILGGRRVTGEAVSDAELDTR